jgi:hypothetical protein
MDVKKEKRGKINLLFCSQRKVFLITTCNLLSLTDVVKAIVNISDSLKGFFFAAFTPPHQDYLALRKKKIVIEIGKTKIETRVTMKRFTSSNNSRLFLS